MRLWRIAQRKYALDRLCAGSALYGGRWNPVGMPALYCGASIAICALEKFVHVGQAPLPPLVLVAVDFPDECDIFTPAASELPTGWDELPTSTSVQGLGRAWLERSETLAMRVPSVVLPEESNVIVNPLHPDYVRVKLTMLRPFTFDRRMYKQ
ncbi:RES family NAD+ phosphorylase [Massilia sp. 9096]|uniref:RES family NAD+ phosphorylase n=1 Tax=Massilia sp. 9096 TaxID=1500894 RepID=UPI00056B55F4|nr:RES family NAD+ phosphorylase [Massilia sp. 9096]